MPADDVRLRITGAEVHDLEPRRCLLITPNGREVPVPAPAGEVRDWLRRCDGTRTRTELLSWMDPGYADVLDILAADGPARPAPDTGSPRLAATTVLLAGPAELTTPLADILAPAGYARVEVLTTLDRTFSVDAANTVVVAAFAHPAHAELTALGAFCARHELRFFPFRGERGRGIAGPAVTPGTGPDFADALARRRAAEDDTHADEPGPRFGSADTRWLLATAAVELGRWIAGDPAETTRGELELDPVRLTTSPRPVLPMPDRPRPVVAGGDRPELLVDDRTGIVTGVRELPAIPARLRVSTAGIAGGGRVFGVSWQDGETARESAIGKAVARYCGGFLPPDREIRHDSYTRLRRDGVPALDPRRLNLYSPQQYRTAGFPFVPLTTDVECAWLEGFSHTTREPVWVPACLVSPDPGARFTRPLIGAAGGSSEEQALTTGLEAVLERDTATLWWAGTPRLPRLRLPAELRALVAETADTHDVTIVPLDNEFGVPVVAAAVFDRLRRRPAIGFATRPDAIEAAKAALADGFARQLVADNRPVLSPLRVNPADRRHLQDFGRDLPVRDQEGLPALSERTFKAYQDRVEARGFEVISVDLTTRDVAAAGFHAVHTLVPGLVPGLPYRGAGRVRRAAVDLGWRTEPLPEDRLNTLPMPE
ncbi:YcaO-like family protein [Amycolatopsis sp. NPDC051758]|uniref:YcaO-like family protein n=1 Tax=Amycolatopsis sp. NPDC051758 TaxID=3363935 RepID=UPI0037B85EE6